MKKNVIMVIIGLILFSMIGCKDPLTYVPDEIFVSELSYEVTSGASQWLDVYYVENFYIAENTIEIWKITPSGDEMIPRHSLASEIHDLVIYSNNDADNALNYYNNDSRDPDPNNPSEIGGHRMQITIKNTPELGEKSYYLRLGDVVSEVFTITVLP